VASYTTGIVPATGYQLVIGQYSASYMTGYLTNLRITTGSGAAQIYNNNAFVPSTSPLFPASNTAGGSLTTRLLVRVPVSQGKVQTQKLIGAPAPGFSGTQAFPPAPMTGYLTDLTGLAPYGQGRYVASTNGEFSGSTLAWYAFDNTLSTQWASAGSNYATAANGGGYLASNVTVDVSGNSYNGDWLQIQMPVSVVLSSYTVTNRNDGFYNQTAPKNWVILGSRDGTNWTLVNQQVGVTSWTQGGTLTFTVSITQAFSYFRFVTTVVLGTSVATDVNFAQWTLNGSAEGLNITADGRLGVGVVAPTRALEVAGDVVCGGTVSAVNPLMFRNRLINGDFRIDQRGSASTPVAAGYGPDRWSISTAATSASIQRYTLASTNDDVVLKQGFKFGVQVNRGNNGNTDLQQKIELGNCSDMFSQPMVLSFWGRSTSAAGMTVYLGVSTAGTDSYTYSAGVGFNLTTTWQYITVPIPVPVAFSSSTTPSDYGMLIQIRAQNGIMPNGSTQYYTGVQLEKGLVNTPFEVRPFATELALCQRYWEQSYAIGTGVGTNTNIGVVQLYGSSDSGGNMVATQRYQVAKRVAVTPTIYTSTGTAGSWTYARSGATSTATINDNGFSSVFGYNFYIGVGAAWVPCYIQGHWVANAEL
jgi:hypothetical protein